MSELVLGTEEGVFAFHPDSGKFHAEDGPGARVMLAAAGDIVYAVTDDAAVWRRSGHNRWELMTERAVEDLPWTLGADARVPGLVWLGVSPAMVYRSGDGGATWAGCYAFNEIPGRETWDVPAASAHPARTVDLPRPGAGRRRVRRGGGGRRLPQRRRRRYLGEPERGAVLRCPRGDGGPGRAPHVRDHGVGLSSQRGRRPELAAGEGGPGPAVHDALGRGAGGPGAAVHGRGRNAAARMADQRHGQRRNLPQRRRGRPLVTARGGPAGLVRDDGPGRWSPVPTAR